MLKIKNISENNARDILSIKSAVFFTVQAFLCPWNELSSQAATSLFEILFRVIIL